MNLKKIKDDNQLVKYSVVSEPFEQGKGRVGNPYTVVEGVSLEEATEVLSRDYNAPDVKRTRTKAGNAWYGDKVGGGTFFEGFWYTNDNDNCIAEYIVSALAGMSAQTISKLADLEEQTSKD